MIAETVFIPTRALASGPPPGFARWSDPGAILAFLRGKGMDVLEVVNWIHSRVEPWRETFPPPYSRERGFWIYYYGASATRAQLRKLA